MDKYSIKTHGKDFKFIGSTLPSKGSRVKKYALDINDRLILCAH